MKNDFLLPLMPFEKIIANALISLLDGCKGAHEISYSTGLCESDCEEILLANDLAIWRHDKENYGNPFKVLSPDKAGSLTKKQLNESYAKNKDKYTAADKRLLDFLLKHKK